MAEKDIGSLVVMEHGELVGMLTFREVIQSIVKQRRQLRRHAVYSRHGRRPADLHAPRPSSTRCAA
jgi:CBS domain-containing protein